MSPGPTYNNQHGPPEVTTSMVPAEAPARPNAPAFIPTLYAEMAIEDRMRALRLDLANAEAEIALLRYRESELADRGVRVAQERDSACAERDEAVADAADLEVAVGRARQKVREYALEARALGRASDERKWLDVAAALDLTNATPGGDA